jgi:hypothetical protein
VVLYVAPVNGESVWEAVEQPQKTEGGKGKAVSGQYIVGSACPDFPVQSICIDKRAERATAPGRISNLYPSDDFVGSFNASGNEYSHLVSHLHQAID